MRSRIRQRFPTGYSRRSRQRLKRWNRKGKSHYMREQAKIEINET